MALMGVLPRRWARAIIESRFFSTWLIWLVVPDYEDQTFADDINYPLLWSSPSNFLGWITKQSLLFPDTRSPFPLSPQLQREISS